MMWRKTALVLPVVAVLVLGSRICCSLTTDESSNTGITNNAQLWHHQTNSQENIDETEILAKRHVRRGVGDELTALKDKAKMASSVYKWLKKNWQKLFVIVIAICALIAVVGIYRRCFSDSGSSGDDEQPSIVVVRMLKQDHKEKKELSMEQTAMEGSTQETGDSGKMETSARHGADNPEYRGRTDTTITETSSNCGKTQKGTCSALAVTRNVKEQHVGVTSTSFPAMASKHRLNEVEFPNNFHIPTSSIPISGYTTFQQIDCYKGYFHFNQYMFNVKTMADQPKVHPTRVCQGSTSEGPFPFYEDIPLIKNLMTSLMLKYCDDYIPTASTKTNLPLTVSP